MVYYASMPYKDLLRARAKIGDILEHTDAAIAIAKELFDHKMIDYNTYNKIDQLHDDTLLIFNKISTVYNSGWEKIEKEMSGV